LLAGVRRAVFYIRPDLRLYDFLDAQQLTNVGPKEFLALPVNTCD